MGLVASVWRPGEHPGGHGGTYGTSSQFCEDGSLAKRTKLVAQIFHLPVANRTGPLTQDGAVVFLRASGVLKQKQLCGRTRVILLPSPHPDYQGQAGQCPCRSSTGLGAGGLSLGAPAWPGP